jgi:nucleotide-binding universal stress UspA family protein
MKSLEYLEMDNRSFIVAAREPISARAALERACLLAGAGDTIILLHVEQFNVLQLLGEGQLRQAMSDEQIANWRSTNWLDELSKSIDLAPSIHVETLVLQGKPGKIISDYARQIRATAIVVAAHREGILHAFAFGSTALGILRHARCPVIVAARDNSPAEYKNAVVAVDIDPVADRVLANTLALFPKAALNLLHIYRLQAEGQLRLRGLSEDQLAILREHVRDEAERGIASLKTTVPDAKVDLEYGFAGSAILSYVLRQRPNVLVISQHRGSKLEERTLGSITQFLLYNCPCDLVLVP